MEEADLKVLSEQLWLRSTEGSVLHRFAEHNDDGTPGEQAGCVLVVKGDYERGEAAAKFFQALLEHWYTQVKALE